MHLNPSHVVARLQRVVRDRIRPRLHTPLAEVTIDAWRVDGDGEPVPAARAIEHGDFQPFTVGDTWAPAWGTTWLRVQGQVPASELPVELVLDLGWFDHSVGGHAEGLAYRPDGVAVKALHPRNGWVRLTGPGAAPGVLADDGSFTLYVEAAANPLLLGLPPFIETHLGEKPGLGEPEPYKLVSAGLCAFDPEIFALLRDLEATGDLLPHLSTDEPRYWRVLTAVEAALDAPTVAGARAALADALARPAHATAHRMTAVGHAHIDSAWLWPLRETRRKVARTLTNVLTLMETDPDLIYAMSSAQQFAWVEQDHPELFERVKQRVAEGRIVPVGGMWVESDAVMPGGEALVRQITYGKRYFMDTFGHESEVVWLPDSFGYSGAWPQIARQAGYRWFLTQKISWNDTTTFPHHTFQWEGIDGTRILTHFPPADTYAAEVTSAELKHAVSNFRDKAISSHSLLLFGYGDGGGGPNREMVARAHRFADLEGAARVELGRPEEFFTAAEAELGDAAPVWAGELYLELHRGTLTSQVAMKQGNRRSEALLRTVEYLATVAAVRDGVPYPYKQLDEAWKTVLLHQFHDILPGSSISWVHREARERYRNLEVDLKGLLPVGRGEPGKISGWSVAREGDWAKPAGNILDNGILRVEVDGGGRVSSLVDLRDGRQLNVGDLGVLRLYRDEPVRWDAWDLDRHVLRNETSLPQPTVTATSDAITVTTKTGKSTFIVKYRLREGVAAAAANGAAAGGAAASGAAGTAAAQLDITVDVDWQETEHLLKLSLPVAVRTLRAKYETQFGSIERPTHENTLADEAQYEVCSHRWVHVAEPGLGVGVVNDSTYGCDVRRIPGGTDIRPTLLRAPRFPDPDTDRGRHTFRFAVVAGDETVTRAAADDLNAPWLEALADVEPLLGLEIESGHAVIDWIKLADDRSGDVIARVHETRGGRAVARLTSTFPASIVETDLLERPLEATGDRLILGPFQITTLRLSPIKE
ncbi:alpha-mannosidase [Actinoplanes couchii]|uniref:Alpha-mannosidase n=1 Tax=Actinoplanes couchii TaxID=403638 RepID=A0ABQ3XEB8_9ACTN|nr:alpha-mannosidase [Actinoplanes couchii]MDR6317266.1 alpha-mannosidase [Actinoplanes couchii]GID56760.1 alpha-mannosidase [Actinoplanes couchii]